MQFHITAPMAVWNLESYFKVASSSLGGLYYAIFQVLYKKHVYMNEFLRKYLEHRRVKTPKLLDTTSNNAPSAKLRLEAVT